MAEMITNQFFPDSVSPPGETLQEILEIRGMSQAELAERTAQPKKTINEIVRGKAAITPETALQLERVLGISAAFWMAREQNYRTALERGRQLSFLNAQTEWLDQIPYKAMVKLGWIPAKKHKSEQLEEVLRFFGVASPASWDDVWSRAAATYRKSPTFASDPAAIAAWLRKGELEASHQEYRNFNHDVFREALTSVRSLTRELPHNFPELITQECASAGVSVVFVPELPGTSIWGATRWIGPNRALIQLSLRYKTDDHLWFTFFHEAAHVLLHSRRDVFVEAKGRPSTEKESEADQFARNWLIPEPRYRVFKRLGSYSAASISRFASELGIAPGVVVGFLQYDRLLERTACNDLKKRVNWVFDQPF